MIPAQFFLSPFAAIGRRPILVTILICAPFVWSGALDATMVDTAEQFLAATAFIGLTQLVLTRMPTASVRMLVAFFAAFVFCVSHVIFTFGPTLSYKPTPFAPPHDPPGELVWLR